MDPTVVLVDDEIDSIEVFEEYLTLKGVKVIGKARDGNQAAKLYQEKKPDVVLMDVLMPQYDGFHGLAKIREFDNNAKVIMVTGSVDPSTEKDLTDLGAVAIIYKPYDINNVIETISKVIEGKVIVTN